MYKFQNDADLYLTTLAIRTGAEEFKKCADEMRRCAKANRPEVTPAHAAGMADHYNRLAVQFDDQHARAMAIAEAMESA